MRKREALARRHQQIKDPVCLSDVLGLFKGVKLQVLKALCVPLNTFCMTPSLLKGIKQRGSFGVLKSYAFTVQMQAKTLSASYSLVFISDRYLLQFY